MPLSTDGRWTGTTDFNIANPTIYDTAGNHYVDTRGLFVLHAVLLHSGKILCFGGCVENMNYAPLCYLFDPAPAHVADVMSAITFPAGADPFCAHYVQIPDGRVLAVGGSQHDVGTVGSPGYFYRGSTGEKTIALFDPVTETWSASRAGGSPNRLQQGRWYPTAVLLPDGRVAVFSGRRELEDALRPTETQLQFPPGVPNHGIADMVEILSAPASDPGNWSSATLTDATKFLPIYPGLHLAPNGRIYFTHTTWGQQIADPNTASILIGNVATSTTWTDHDDRTLLHRRREEGMSVLLPPAKDGKILVIGGSKALDTGGTGVFDAGGGPADFHHIEDATDPLAADVLDTNTNTWSSVGPMNFGRVNGHCVILPDATVLICGGHDNYKWQDPVSARYPAALSGTNPSVFAEIYTHGTGFRTVALAERGDADLFMHAPRMYHSVALLLPDGRVFVAGGADPNQDEQAPPPPYPGGWNDRMVGLGNVRNLKNYEFFEPPYMHNGPRPVINEITRNGTRTRRIQYGQDFTVMTPQGASIAKVALIRPGAPTHHTDSEQRYVDLTITSQSADRVNVRAVGDSRIAPPGYYMLWIIDNNSPQPRPCQKAEFIQLVTMVGQPGGGTSCVVATAAFGSPYHPSVVYLQGLRQELRESGPTGRHFISAVNRIYESFSPWLARKVSNDTSIREAVREGVVRPVVSTIGATDRLSRHIPWDTARRVTLMAMFALEATIGVMALPALAAAVVGRIGSSKWRRWRASKQEE